MRASVLDRRFFPDCLFDPHTHRAFCPQDRARAREVVQAVATDLRDVGLADLVALFR